MQTATALRAADTTFALKPQPQLVVPETKAIALAWRNPSDFPVAVHGIALACWVAFLAVFWITFSFSANAEFMVAISTVYAIVFFSVPVILTRMSPPERRRHEDLAAFLRARVKIHDGEIGGVDALVQVIVVPACLTLGGIAIGFIIHAARLAH